MWGCAGGLESIENFINDISFQLSPNTIRIVFINQENTAVSYAPLKLAQNEDRFIPEGNTLLFTHLCKTIKTKVMN